MPLKHFIVHYMKVQGHRVDICCSLGRNGRVLSQRQQWRRQKQKKKKTLRYSSGSPCCPCGWTERGYARYLAQFLRALRREQAVLAKLLQELALQQPSALGVLLDLLGPKSKQGRKADSHCYRSTSGSDSLPSQTGSHRLSNGFRSGSRCLARSVFLGPSGS